MSVDFVDTNVVLYLFDETDDRKRDIAEMIVHRGVTRRDVVVSHQVVQEALSAVITKRLSPDPVRDAQILLDEVLVPLWTLRTPPTLYAEALQIHQRYQYHFYDSLIIAAALEAGCDRLLSEDLQHGQRIDGLVIENPFLDE